MTQLPYIVRDPLSKHIVQAEIDAVGHPEIEKVVKVHHVEGIGTLRQVAGTGRYVMSKFSILVNRYTAHTMPSTHEAVRAFIRKLRPEEAAELDRIDDAITALREQRREVVMRAWARGHAVTVKELEAQITGPSRKAQGEQS